LHDVERQQSMDPSMLGVTVENFDLDETGQPLVLGTSPDPHNKMRRQEVVKPKNIIDRR